MHFLFKINWNGLIVFTLISKNCFLIRVFSIRTAEKNELSSNEKAPLYIMHTRVCMRNEFQGTVALNIHHGVIGLCFILGV